MSSVLENSLELADQFQLETPPASAQLTLPIGASLAGWIDHTILKPEATASQVRKLCEEARHFQFATVCINPAYVSLAAGLLKNTGVGICSVVGFPLGATFPEIKAAETRQAIEAGATEIESGSGGVTSHTGSSGRAPAAASR